MRPLGRHQHWGWELQGPGGPGTPGESRARRSLAAACRLCPSRVKPLKARGPCWSSKRAQGKLAELQQITLFKTESPKYIWIDIIKQGSVDRKVQCHPHQDPWWRRFALQKASYEVNYINYQIFKNIQHLRVLNLWFTQHGNNRFRLFYRKEPVAHTQQLACWGKHNSSDYCTRTQRLLILQSGGKGTPTREQWEIHILNNVHND